MIGLFLKIICTAAIVLFIVPFVIADDIVDQKNDLERIQKQIEESRRNLDSLKGKESKMLKEISDYEQRESMSKTLVNRLNKQLATLRANIGNSKDRLDDAEGQYENSRKRYISNLKYYYTGLRNVTSDMGDEINWEYDSFRRAVYPWARRYFFA